MPINICLQCKNKFKVRGIKRAAVAGYCSRSCRSIATNFKVKKGMRSHRLVIIEEIENEIQYCHGVETKIRKVKCKCDCGKIKITRLTYFRTGYTKSCGCLIRENDKYNLDTSTHKLSKTKVYHKWCSMRDRCLNEKNVKYRYYGGRGVKICEDWINSFESFYKWAMENGYADNLELDKDKLGDGLLYSPNTCCFLTKVENMKYRRKIQSK